MRTRILSRADVRDSMDMPAAIEAVRSAFVALSAGRADVPLRTAVEADGGSALVMPAHVPEAGGLGAKVVAVFEGNAARGLPTTNALVLALDAATGMPRAVIEGTYLTALRTGAASGLATDLLARPESTVVAIFGAGAQARTQLEAVRAVRRIGQVRIVSRTKESARRLADELRNVDVRLPDGPAAAVRGADVVIAATTSHTPVFDGRAVEPGTHVNGIGSYTPDMQEVDAALVRRSTIVVDSREGALAEAGDLLIPIHDGVVTTDDIHAELGEIATGARPGRRLPEEVTFFKSVGNAAQDIAVVARLLETAEAAGLGTVVDL